MFRAAVPLILGLLVPAVLPAQTSNPATPSTRAMEDRLHGIYAGTDWRADPNKPAERAQYLGTILGRPDLLARLSPQQELTLRQQLGTELLRAGDPQGSLLALAHLQTRAETLHLTLTPQQLHNLHFGLALASLRLGEQQNCRAMHGQHSCLFPIGPGGQHHLPEGAQGAIRELTLLLDADPQHPDPLCRWLLNLAYQQLGQYPRQVPPAYLLPESLFRSDPLPDGSRFPEWLDVATLAGTDVTQRSGGVLVEDFDGDGLLDLVLSSSGPLDQMHLLHNNGDGTFSDRTREAGLLGETGGLNLVLTDFNNDGHPDILVLRGAWWGRFGQYPLSLLQNRGDGTFTDVTLAAGLDSPHPTQTAAWADFDNDGWLDLIVPHESSPEDPAPTQLFHNNHDGTFTDVAPSLHLEQQGFVKGVAWGDLNNDGRPDLYLSTKAGPNRLFRNDGPCPASSAQPFCWRFTDITAAARIGSLQNTFSTFFFDADNDGWPDLFVAGYSADDALEDVGRFMAGEPTHTAARSHLFHNNHDGTFTDLPHAAGLDRAILTMGSGFGDLDNDGFLDVYLGTGEPAYQALVPNRMFRNNGPGAHGLSFSDVTTDGGFGHLQKGHGIAFADLEHRGVEDIIEEMGGAFPGDTYQSSLYRNPGSPNHSITLALVGRHSNHAAVGARLDLLIHEPGRPPRHLIRTHGFVSSFGSSPLSREHIGLGTATVVDELRVRWPSPVQPHEQVFRNLRADQLLCLTEDDPTPVPVPLRPFTLGQAPLHAAESSIHHH